MASVYESLKGRGAAVRVLHCERVDAVITPVAVSGKLRYPRYLSSCAVTVFWPFFHEHKNHNAKSWEIPANGIAIHAGRLFSS